MNKYRIIYVSKENKEIHSVEVEGEDSCEALANAWNSGERAQAADAEAVEIDIMLIS